MASHYHLGIVKPQHSVELQITSCSCTESFLAIPASKTEVGLWKLSELDKRPIFLRGHTSGITALCFGNERNPTLICSASEDAIFVWKTEDAFINFNTGELVTGTKIAEKLGNCQHLCYSPDDAYLAACIQNEVWIINLPTCNLIATLEGHPSTVTGAIFCPHSWSTFVTISDDRTFKVWNIETASLEYQSSIVSSSPFLSVAMHPEHKHFAVGSADGILRVYDLTSHRILNEVNIPLVLQKTKYGRSTDRRNSEENSKPKVISSLPTWQQRQDPINTISTSEVEEGCAILGLSYWWEDGGEDGEEITNERRRNSLIRSPRRNSLLDHDTTVREVFKDPPFLVVGCTSTLLLLNANTMEIVHCVDLYVPLICHTISEVQPTEYNINTAGNYAFARSESTKQIVCVIGSMFESIAHILNIQPDRCRTSETLEDLPKADFTLSDFSEEQSDDGFVETAYPNEITVLSRAILVPNSPLRAELFPKKKPTGKKASTRTGADKMNQPLTFHSKVKSSGYTEQPRARMFSPKTNVSKSAPEIPLLKPKTTEKKVEANSFLSEQYPINSAPPMHLEDRYTLTPKPTSITCIKFSDDGKHLACSMGNKNAHILKIPYSGKMTTFVGHDNVINSACLSHDNSWFLTASADRTAKIWSPSHSEPVLTFSNIKHNFISDNISSNTEEGNPNFPKEITKAAFYYVDKFILLSSLNTLYLYKYHVNEIKNDVKRYHTNNKYKLVKAFEMDDIQNITTFSAVNSFYSYIVLVARSNKSLAVIDMNVGKIVSTIDDVHTRNIHTICQNEGSPFVSHPPEAYDLFLTSAATDGLKLWDLRANRCIRRFEGHVNRAKTVGLAISPCSRFIATGSEDRSTYLFDVRSSAPLKRLASHSDVVSAVDFHPQCPMLATATYDGQLRFYKDVN